MDAPDTFGQRLRAAMRAAKVRNREVADAAGVHLNTVSQWLNDRFPPSEANLAAVAPVVKRSVAWLRYGDEGYEGYAPTVVVSSVSENSSRASMGVTPRHARNLPLSVREYLAEFHVRLVKGGASEDEIDEAMALLRSPDVFSYFKGGKLAEYNEQDVLDGMRSLGEDVVIPRLQKLGRKVK